MSEYIENEKVVWTPQMPDRRKNDRRNNTRDFQTNGKSLNVSDMSNNSERRQRTDRRKKVTVTITGRAMDVEK